MSAFDLTGAAISTPVAVFIWVMFVYGIIWEPEETKTLGILFLYGLLFAGWAVFCIARLCGATL